MVNFKKLFVLLLAFVLLSCTVSAFAETNYTMEVNFYNYDDSSLSNPIIYKGSETFYGYVEVKDNTTHETYWSYKQLSLQSDGKTWKTQLTDFWPASTTADQKGETTASYSYDSTKCTFKQSRLYVERPSYYAIHEDVQLPDDTVTEPNDTIKGYQFKTNNTSDPTKSVISILELQHEKAFLVQIDFDPKLSTTVN